MFFHQSIIQKWRVQRRQTKNAVYITFLPGFPCIPGLHLPTQNQLTDPSRRTLFTNITTIQQTKEPTNSLMIDEYPQKLLITF